MSVTDFKTLHENEAPFLLGNVWDAHSAQLVEKAGFAALGTSSHAIANLLGYEDGENMSFEEHLFLIQRVLDVAGIPVSVDFEAGYSDDPKTVAKYVRQLADAGVVGINLEDGSVVNGKRQLGPASALADKIKAIKDATDVFINARPDTYTTKHPDALSESIDRAGIYQQAGADGIFVPLIEKPDDIRAFTQAISLPLNVFLTPRLPAYSQLGVLGVKRISHGGKIYGWLAEQAKDAFEILLKDRKLPS